MKLFATLLLSLSFSLAIGQEKWQGEIPDPEIILVDMASGKPIGPFPQILKEVRLSLNPDSNYYNFDPKEAQFVAAHFVLSFYRGEELISEVKIDQPYAEPDLWGEINAGQFFGELNTSVSKGDQLIIKAVMVKRAGMDFKPELTRTMTF